MKNQTFKHFLMEHFGPIKAEKKPSGGFYQAAPKFTQSELNINDPLCQTVTLYDGSRFLIRVYGVEENAANYNVLFNPLHP